MKPMIRYFDEDGVQVDREMNDTEFAQYTKDMAELQAKRDNEAKDATAKAALLERLGITADEAALLIG